jgi:plastocyanin
MKKFINSEWRWAGVVALLFITLSISNSCTKISDKPGPNEVFIENMAFNPVNITVAVNTTVTWTNKDNAAHNVTSDPSGPLNSPSIGSNGIYSHLFTTAGTFHYKCTLHLGMTGTVTVQ